LFEALRGEVCLLRLKAIGETSGYWVMCRMRVMDGLALSSYRYGVCCMGVRDVRGHIAGSDGTRGGTGSLASRECEEDRKHHHRCQGGGNEQRAGALLWLTERNVFRDGAIAKPDERARRHGRLMVLIDCVQQEGVVNEVELEKVRAAGGALRSVR
jgi:hypothetical protein